MPDNIHRIEVDIEVVPSDEPEKKSFWLSLRDWVAFIAAVVFVVSFVLCVIFLFAGRLKAGVVSGGVSIVAFAVAFAFARLPNGRWPLPWWCYGGGW